MISIAMNLPYLFGKRRGKDHGACLILQITRRQEILRRVWTIDKDAFYF